MTEQRYAVALLVFMTEGKNKYNIMGNGHECNWSGITCYAEKGFNDTIREIKLRNHKLTGSLQAKIGELKGLQIIDLSSNSITWSLPETIANMRMLKSINIQNNFIMGSIAKEFGIVHLES